MKIYQLKFYNGKKYLLMYSTNSIQDLIDYRQHHINLQLESYDDYSFWKNGKKLNKKQFNEEYKKGEN